MDELVKAARSLSDPARVRVLHLLMQRECCVCEVMDVLDISQVNASRYCNALKEAGFLRMRKDGRWKHYSVDREGLSPVLKDMLDAVREAAAGDTAAVGDTERLRTARRRSEEGDKADASVRGHPASLQTA